MKTGYEILKTSLAEAANDNLTLGATVVRVINDLTVAGLAIVPNWPPVDYDLPLMVMDAKVSHPATLVYRAASVKDFYGRFGALVTWFDAGRARSCWFDVRGQSAACFDLRVMNISGPVPTVADMNPVVERVA
ncbi:hypothetical protein [Thalassospira sp. MCCC 1A01428]|uniref:hypothetical protein n=1 Tax=Thalassospira sp. MCCC 1A01428 TaxID=1470575 RepID=UPI000A1F7413|nr:hypothetical protein [Thalassospira sp. MCCC 1A01428]OSQ34177.1 hypothetical protein THS27_25695 [Thalassospira sp. MCCC 1A01428]